MAKLGEAYIQILADLSKFDKSVDKQVQATVQKLEKALSKSFGNKLGMNLGSGFTDGFQGSVAGLGKNLQGSLSVPANSAGVNAGRRFTQGVGAGLRDKDPITKALASLVSALEDGFSALPAELKATVGGFLVASLAPIGAAVGAAVGAAIIGGITASGIALAFQFEQVEARGVRFADSLRDRLLMAAESFVDATLNGIDELDYQIAQLEPTLKKVFDRAAVFVDPLAQGVGRFLDEVVQGLDRGLEGMDIQGFINTLVSGFEYLGVSIGDAFEVILSNPNLDDTLFDLAVLVGDLVTVGADFLSWSLDAYQAMLQVADVVYQVVETFEDLYQIINKIITMSPGAWDSVENFFGADDRTFRIHTRVRETDDAFGNFNRTLDATTTATEAQKKAIRELNRQMEDQTRAARDAISAEIDYQRAIDDVTEALKKGKPSLDLDKETARDLASEYLNAIDSLDKFTDAQVTKGKMTEAQAKAFYDTEIKRLRDQFKARGGSLKQFDELFADYIKLSGLPPIPDPTKNLVAGADNAFDALSDVLRILIAVNAQAAKTPSGNIKVPGGTQIKGFQRGGMISEPSLIMAGENYRPELILPETDPRRSMQLLSQSSLASVIGGGPTTVYAVFDGEPFQARIVRTAQSVSRSNARTLNQVPRNI